MSYIIPQKDLIKALCTKIDLSAGTDACHPWTGSKKSSGYAIIWTGTKHQQAHYVLWELTHGPIPKEKWLARICGNKICMNLAHCELRWRKKYQPKKSIEEKELEQLARRIQQFWNRVDKSKGDNECWPWTGGKNHLGYGKAGWGSKNVAAHRVAWMITHGPIPPDNKNKKGTLYVLHKCDNPICVNPKHLFLGTQKDNLQDASKKGRMRKLKG